MTTGKHLLTTLLALLLLLIFLVISCAPSGGPKVAVEKPYGIAPSDLTVDVNHGQATLRWKTNRGDAIIQGYNVYLSESPVVEDDGSKIVDGASPYNDEVYPGDTDPATESESVDIDDLADGMYYYASVTTVFSGGSESRPSKQVRFVCYPSGKFLLNRSYYGERDGYSLSKAEYVPTDDFDNFLYYSSINGDDYLLSPSRLDDVLKSVEFREGNFRSISDAFEPEGGIWSDKIKISQGSRCLLRTESGQLAKLIVRGFSGSGEDRQVNVEYRFMPMVGNTDF